MRHRILLALSALMAASAAAFVPAAVASAHAVIVVGGYHVAIGWLYEPAGGNVTYVDQPNGIQVFVDTVSASGDIGTPVGDLNSDCTHPDFQVTVTFAGTTSSPICPQPAFDADTGLGRTDEYDAAVTPTRVGNYTFHIFGTIHGVAIDKTVTSGPSTFDTVGDQSSVQFPTAAPALSDVAAKVNAVSARIGDTLSTAQRAASSANDAANAANRASIIAIIAVVLAVLLGGANLVVTLRRRST